MDPLLTSIEEYKTQLEQVESALALANEEEKKELQELQLNLLQLIELTLSQVESTQAGRKTIQDQNTQSSPKSEHGDQLDEEFALFKAEIAEITTDNDGSDSIENAPYTEEEEEKILKKLNNLEGELVRVPFVERWGGYTYHNAVVLSLELNEENQPDFEDPKLIVLFNQPTSTSMVPCPYFLDSRCKFSDEKCKFSHGEKISLSDIKPYKKPDTDSIISGSPVLALHKDFNIWHKGIVDDVLRDRSSFSFNCEVCCNVFEVSINALEPISLDDENIPTDKELPNEKDESSKNQLDEEKDFIPNKIWLKSANSKEFGDWEKHTKGIGSKLMAMMGYVIGTGLGPKGEGKIDPVTTYVYPQGVSLDRCMELREASNGEELLEVEKKLRRIQKKEEDKLKRHAEYLFQNTSVFDIINTKLDGKSSTSSSEGSKQRMDVSTKSLKNDSTKTLTRKNLQLGSHIQKLEGDIKKLKESKERQSKDATTSQIIESKIAEKSKELHTLRDAENKIAKEQKSRKDAKSSFVF